MRPKPMPAYAFLNDPDVPAFDSKRILLVMDGNCALCSNAARHIARLDRKDLIRIAPATSPLGQALLRHFAIDLRNPETWLMIENGKAIGALDGVLRLGLHLHPLFWFFQPLRLLPEFVRDWLYARVARNRFALFGQADLCQIPCSALQQRIVR